MKNQLIDLNNHLFAQMERLGNEELNAEELKIEIERSKAMNSVSEQIIDNATLALSAKKFLRENGQAQDLPAMIETSNNA